MLRESDGVSFFVLSRKTLPSYINYPLVSFYITIVYAIGRLLRSGLIPLTDAIIIEDAHSQERQGKRKTP